MKTFKNYVTEEEELFEALAPQYKDLVNGVKKYFKDTYGCRNVAFKTIPNKMPVLVVAARHGKANCLNPKDLDAMRTIKPHGGPSIRGDSIDGDMEDWAKFMKGIQQ